MKKREYALRSELLERNPILKKNWWTRAFAAVIVGGAGIHPNDWPRLRIAIFGMPIVGLIFIINLTEANVMSRLDLTLTIIFIVICLGGAPLLFALAYGYWHRDDIDTTGGVAPDFSYLKKHTWLWAGIGVLVSTGVGIFGWFGSN